MKDGEFLARMGAKVRQARKAANLSQKELAALCRFDHSTISETENGHYSLKVTNLKRIAEALGKDIKDFV